MSDSDLFHRVWDSDSSGDLSDSSQGGEEPTCLATSSEADTKDTRSKPSKDRVTARSNSSNSIDSIPFAVPKSTVEICCICRGLLMDDRFSCIECTDHVLCRSCHDRFAGEIWPSQEHQFVLMTPRIGRNTGSPVAGLSPDFSKPARDQLSNRSKRTKPLQSVADQPPRSESPLDAVDFNALLASEPSLGSIHHKLGHCHPCHYAHSKAGCRHGRMCGLCHYPHTRKRNAKTKDAAAQRGLWIPEPGEPQKGVANLAWTIF